MKRKPIEHARGTRQAIALHYGGKGAPRLTAKGEGELAERILEIAQEHDVPVHRDPALSMALSRVPLGEEIPENLYVAVAEVLAFIYMLSGRRPENIGKDQDSD
ncbi:type III secretion protein [Ectothiorhodospira shaposhnikovii]|uniref:EscU/YscU/HrcU family type III secretion system export apparatus switch protein n=1 Tax=Ectothiorhodospira shaposhnikovii TaxID=1054 RepID=UPI001904D953|nr:EscU/YscU/HrcU family type III secretion system export apparatus switch protein [Ectothiorhodospira shaposhnikovii]MBK1674019.1 type III secretion protein [Ectothiorhodospira shaposhnikovii]